MSLCTANPKSYIAKTPLMTRTTNENNININLPQQLASTCGENIKAITLQPDPIKLAIDTSTDWPAIAATSFVGLTGACVAFAVGYMAYLGQRNNVRASKANFRHGWQQEIKQLIAKFIAIIARIHYETGVNANYLDAPESNQMYSDLIETHARIELMLDQSKEYSKGISIITGDLIEAVKAREIDAINKLSNELLKVANGVIEQTWQDIRNDLEGKEKK